MDSATKQAYAAVVYFRSSYDDGTFCCPFVVFQDKSSPSQTANHSTLRVVGGLHSRGTNERRSELSTRRNQEILLDDSKTAFCSITNEKPWKQYVNQRVTEIRRLTTKEEWRHCPGSLNPADVPSRGMTGQEMVNWSTWWDSPKYLQLSDSEWPNDQSANEINCDAMLEVAK